MHVPTYITTELIRGEMVESDITEEAREVTGIEMAIGTSAEEAEAEVQIERGRKCRKIEYLTNEVGPTIRRGT